MGRHEFVVGQTATGYTGTPGYQGRHRLYEPRHAWMAGPGWWPARPSGVKRHRRGRWGFWGD